MSFTGVRSLDKSAPLFADRADAGRQLARTLSHLRGTEVVVLALPRGGVPVAYEVARELHAPLDVIVVSKLGVPFQPEYGFGAVGEGGVRIIDDVVVRRAGLSRPETASVEARERARLDRRLSQLRGGAPPMPLAGRTALVVDDGIATGATARAACLVARARGARRVIVAVPVGGAGAVASLRSEADEVACLRTVSPGCAVGAWYGDFSQVSDAEVAALLGPGPTSADPGGAAPARTEVTVDVAGVQLPGTLAVPSRATGLVVFAHGSGNGRLSPRNQFMAAGLNRAGLGTFLADLLTADEELSRACVFDVALLAVRLKAITRWLGRQPATAAIPVAYFGASTGTAAALAAVTDTPRLQVTAIVSRGGRPDLVGGRLGLVQTPTLLIVGGADKSVLDLNQRARAQLRCESRLTVIPGATRLLEEPGALGQVTDLAGDWFIRNFARMSNIAAAA
jgi:putative phosphoribosyl transferase